MSTGRREHLPVRPVWLCRVDAHPWPCGAARVSLMRQYVGDRTSLAVYLAPLMHDAIDLYQLSPDAVPSPAVLWDRFFAWLDVTRRSALF
ncbi:hypothetical protein [Micromonospora deserti]|uniref:Flavin reductase n=1 Tax=Micromonospora deserti TaxID=2070366 RepID=A0A2W2CTP0_9ACTN|nr:hypothetical protein [Micromonospora deserti]PZF91719.1 hypothetical protein C1I99_22930 [Micromonospora deserti]